MYCIDRRCVAINRSQREQSEKVQGCHINEFIRYIYSDRRRQSCDAVTRISAGRRALFSPCMRLFRNRNLVKRLLIFVAMISTAVAARKLVRNACGGPVFIYTPFSLLSHSALLIVLALPFVLNLTVMRVVELSQIFIHSQCHVIHVLQ